MTTSGITLNQLTRNQFIEAALRKLNVLAQGQTPSTEDYTNGTLAFNNVISEFRTLGMPLWARNKYSFGLTLNVGSYNIGVGQTLNTPYPLHLVQAYRMETGSTTHIPMEIVADFNYNLFPQSSGGQPIQITYQPKINMGVLQVWAIPDASAVANSTVYIVYHRPIEYMNLSTDTLDFPEEWNTPIIYQLAKRLAPEWGLPLQDRQMLSSEAEAVIARVLDFGFEDGSLFIQPSRGSH